MTFGIVRLFRATDPQKAADVTNEHLDKYNRKNAYIGKSLTRPNVLILATRYESLSEKAEMERENRDGKLMENIGGGEFLDLSLIKPVNSTTQGDSLNSNSYLSLFGGENSDVRKTTELSKQILEIDGQSLLDNGITTFQSIGITGTPVNRTFIWHGIASEKVAEKVLVDGVSQFHSEAGLELIRETAPLWTTKNRGFFQTLRNMG
tara:strand:+ start:485 stop:1102 length:618 start_codon:yes stop_codon:yes gene_type:complete